MTETLPAGGDTRPDAGDWRTLFGVFMRDQAARILMVRAALPLTRGIDKALRAGVEKAARKGVRIAPAAFVREEGRWLQRTILENPDVAHDCLKVAEHAAAGELGAVLRTLVGFDSRDDSHIMALTDNVRLFVFRSMEDVLVLAARALVTTSELEAVTLTEKALGMASSGQLATFHQRVGARRRQIGEELRARLGAARPEEHQDLTEDAVLDAWTRAADLEKARPIQRAVREAKTEASMRDRRGGLTKVEADRRRDEGRHAAQARAAGHLAVVGLDDEGELYVARRPDEATGPAVTLSAQDLAEVAALSEQEKAALVAVYDGANWAEAAAILGVSDKTAKAKLQKITDRFNGRSG